MIGASTIKGGSWAIASTSMMALHRGAAGFIRRPFFYARKRGAGSVQDVPARVRGYVAVAMDGESGGHELWSNNPTKLEQIVNWTTFNVFRGENRLFLAIIV